MKTPDQFTDADIEEIPVKVLNGYPGCYNGPETPMMDAKAKAGPIGQLLSSFMRLACVNEGHEARAYERQWLTAVWRPDIQAWTIDHPAF